MLGLTTDNTYILPILREQNISKIAVRRLASRPVEGLRCHTLYFDGGIDVRICAKNGCSSIKSTFSMLKAGVKEPVAQEYRIRKSLQLVERGKIDPEENYQFFRTDSKRYAVARDPVERAVSACLYLHRKTIHNRNPSLDQITHFLDNFTLWDNTHLFLNHFTWVIQVCMIEYLR